MSEPEKNVVQSSMAMRSCCMKHKNHVSCSGSAFFCLNVVVTTDNWARYVYSKDRNEQGGHDNE